MGINKIQLLVIYLFGLTQAHCQEENFIKNQPITFNFVIESTSETAKDNPFLDYRLDMEFSFDNLVFKVPAYYAADGNASETGASEGGVWRVKFTPNKVGRWRYYVSFQKGKDIAINEDPYVGDPISPYHGRSGSFIVSDISADATAFDRSGRLQYNGSRYLFTEDGKPLLKFGANSPENFFAYAEFDGTYSYDSTKQFLKTWDPHKDDWKKADPIWKDGKGKGIIGALNYLASKGMNSVYALTLNIEGDARDVWPFISHKKEDFTRYDVSKLAQWDIVISHAESLGIIMHLLTQEKENELILDDGYTLTERKLYYRELIARFGYHKNIIWNMGEENGAAPFWRQGQNDQQRFAMIRYLKDHDPYMNPIVIHTLPEAHERDLIVDPLLGFDRLDGLSMQISNVFEIHETIKDWVLKSQKANRPWMVMMDEIGPWHTGTRTDEDDPRHDTLRREVLWGTLLAGGAGVEWYFGWNKPPNDLNAEDWRSRNNIWEQSKIAIDIFNQIPFWEMTNMNEILSSKNNYCFGKTGGPYLIYMKHGGSSTIDLNPTEGEFNIHWYNPREGGSHQAGSVKKIQGGDIRSIGNPPMEEGMDWVVILKRD